MLWLNDYCARPKWSAPQAACWRENCIALHTADSGQWTTHPGSQLQLDVVLPVVVPGGVALQGPQLGCKPEVGHGHGACRRGLRDGSHVQVPVLTAHTADLVWTATELEHKAWDCKASETWQISPVLFATPVFRWSVHLWPLTAGVDTGLFVSGTDHDRWVGYWTRDPVLVVTHGWCVGVLTGATENKRHPVAGSMVDERLDVCCHLSITDGVRRHPLATGHHVCLLPDGAVKSPSVATLHVVHTGH